MDLFEDSRAENGIFFDTRIVRTTEALMYSSNLYRELGADGNISVRFAVRHTGLKGRILGAVGRRHVPPGLPSSEDEVISEVSFLLSDFEKDPGRPRGTA
jgi:hypothetical protein